VRAFGPHFCCWNRLLLPKSCGGVKKEVGAAITVPCVVWTEPGAKGEAAWQPLAVFEALLLSVWYDLSDVRLAEAHDDRASYRRFCGFSSNEPTPERTAFLRFRRVLVTADLDRILFETITAQSKARSIT
jgi:hypothetical protein